MAYDTFGNWMPENSALSTGISAVDKKIAQLTQATEEKLANLDYIPQSPARNKNLLDGSRPLEQGMNGGSGYSMFNGEPVSNKDRIYNDYDTEEMGQFASDLYDQRTKQDEDGYLYLLNPDGSKAYLKDQNQDQSHLYGGLSKDGSLNKRGKAEYGVEERYTPGMAYREGLTNNRNYGWNSGPKGIDAKNAYMNWQMAQGNVEKAESVGLGNQGNISNRYMFDNGTLDAHKKRQAVRSGASEYEKTGENTSTFGGVNLKPWQVSKGRSIFDEQGLKRYETVDSKGKVEFKPKSMMTEYEKLAYANAHIGNSRNPDGILSPAENDGWAGQLADLAQASGISTLAGIGDAASTGLGRAAKSAGLINEETAKEMSNINIPFFDGKMDDYKDLEAMGKEFGVDEDRKNRVNAELQASARAFKDNPGISTFINSVATGALNGPEVVMENVGETVTAWVPWLIPAQAAARTNNSREKYMENNGGRAPTKEWETLSFASNMTALVMEKFVLGKAFSGLGKGLTSKIKGKVGKKITAGLVRAFGSMGGEGAQEYFDTVQQELFTMKDNKKSLLENIKTIGSSDDAILAGIIGASVGGGLHATGEAANVAKNIPASVNDAAKTYSTHRTIKNMKNNLSDTDHAFAKLSAESEIESNKAEIESISQAREEIKAVSDGDKAFEDLGKSENSATKKIYEAIEKETTNKAIEDGNVDTSKLDNFLPAVEIRNSFDSNIVGEEVASANRKKHNIPDDYKTAANGMADATKIAIDLSKTDEGIALAVSEYAVKNEDAVRDAITEKGKEYSTEKIKNYVFDSGFEDAANEQIAAKEKIVKKLGKTPKARNPNDVGSDTAKDFDFTWTNVIPTIVASTFGNPIDTGKFEGFSEGSLKRALKEADTRQAKLINKVLANRQNAKSDAGIDRKVLDSDYVAVQRDMELGDTKVDTLKASKNIMSQRAFRSIEEVDNARTFLDKALAAKHINKAQHKILKDRLSRIDKNTASDLLKREQSDREGGKEKTEETASPVTTVNENNYKFTDSNGKKVEGKIVGRDNTARTISVEFINENGETETIKFRTNGQQRVNTGDPVEFMDGEEFEATESTENTEDTENSDESEESHKANSRANNLDYPGFYEITDADIDMMEDVDIQKNLDILNQLVDC